MKKTLFIACIMLISIACKNENKSNQEETLVDDIENQSDDLTLIKGEFVYYDDAAVLQSYDEIYGVFITDKMLELSKQAQAHKKLPTDMVLVEVKAKVTKQKDEKILWDNKAEIIEILSVSAIDKENNNIVKLGK